MKKFLIFVYPALSIVLLIYSYTQVDLNLTLFRAPIWLSFQRGMQNIGYFQRPLSTEIFALLFILFVISYFLFLKFSNKFTKRQIWLIILATSAVLTFSYNAFSYDLFNYIFDAKILTHYHQNPYFYKALDFPKDPMLLFMHWTHRTYPYGPIWLGVATPLSFLGRNLFIPTFFLFKILSTVSFLGTAFLIGKISKRLFNSENLSLVFFSLNPLVLIESLVSAHNDITMMFFAMLGIFLFINKKYPGSFASLLLSTGVKFATGLLLPLMIYSMVKKISWEKFFTLSIFLMLLAVVVASVRTTFQPWYLLYVLPIAAVIAQKTYIKLSAGILSTFALFNYVPFLYLGNWDKSVPTILFFLTLISAVISALILLKYKHEVI